MESRLEERRTGMGLLGTTAALLAAAGSVLFLVLGTSAQVSAPGMEPGLLPGDRVYVLERWGNYFSGPPLIGPMAGLVGHPRVTVIYPDGRKEVVAAVTNTWTRVIFYGLVLVLLSVLAVRLRRSARRGSSS